MLPRQFLRRSIRFLATAGVCIGAAAGAQAADTYNYTSNTLIIPLVSIGNANYTNMVVTGGGLVAASATGPAVGTQDIYDPATGNLTIPTVNVYTEVSGQQVYVGTYYNVVTKVASMVSLGGVYAADTYTGAGTIHIPFLDVTDGGTNLGVFTNVEIAGVSLASPPILSLGGGLPPALDSWSLSSGQLTLSAISVGSLGTYTNPELALNFTSAGGPSYSYIKSVGAVAPMAYVPSVYVIDGNSVLHVFDAYGGTPTGGSPVTVRVGNISNLAGGGITTDANNVYVTVGYPNEVLAYNKVDLAPVALSPDAFQDVNVPRGIAYDSVNRQFYVGNGASNVTIFDANGLFLSAIDNNVYGPSGVAFDVLNETVWVANYTGGSGSNPTYGIAEFNGNGSSAQTLNPAATFLAPTNPSVELPYSVAYCQPQYPGAGGFFGPTYIAVGYLSDRSGAGTPELGIYSTSGELVAAASPPLNSAQQPNAISCSSTGTIYVATNDGLVLYSNTGAVLPTPTGFQGLPTPIYGVYVTY